MKIIDEIDGNILLPLYGHEMVLLIQGCLNRLNPVWPGMRKISPGRETILPLPRPWEGNEI
jgi:hypothetical protein